MSDILLNLLFSNKKKRKKKVPDSQVRGGPRLRLQSCGSSAARRQDCGASPLTLLCPSVCLPVTALLRKLKQQSRDSVEDKRPKLLKALKEVDSPPLAQPRPCPDATCLTSAFISCRVDATRQTFISFQFTEFIVSWPPRRQCEGFASRRK